MKQKLLLTITLWLTLLGSAWAQTNNALYFDGTNDYVRIKAINPSNFTVEAWVCPTALGKDQAILSTLSTNSNTGMELHIASDNIPVLTIHGGIGFIDIKGTTAITANTWTHIAATYNGYSASIYVNGVQTKSVLANTYQAGTQALYLGRRLMSGVLFFTGKIDEVRVWNSSRTQAEIIEAMTSNLTGTETGLLAYYTFNQGMVNGNNSGVNTLYDATTNRNNGSLTYFTLSGTTSNWVEGYNSDSYTDTIYVYTDQIVLADTAGSSQAFFRLFKQKLDY